LRRNNAVNLRVLLSTLSSATARKTIARGQKRALNRESEFIRFEVCGKVGHVTLDRPDTLNAITSSLDRVCLDFLDLRVIMAHGADPWWNVAIRLMIKSPISTS
jgi:hypothetical protein